MHAIALQKYLERFKVPRRLNTRFADRHPLRPVFRDQTELSSGQLSEAINKALAVSGALVVICSPAAARSRWVDAEIRSFKSLHGDKRVFALIVSGKPNADNAEEECFPPALLSSIDSQGEFTGESLEILAANSTGSGGRRDAFLRITAALLDVGFDELKQRAQQRRQRQFASMAAGAIVIAAITTGLAVTAYFAKAEAELHRNQADDLISFMLGDLRTRLETIGRVDVLDAVGDKAMDYFSSRSRQDDPSTLDKRALTIRQIGEVRVAQGRFDEGLAAFTEAMELLKRSNAISDADETRLTNIAHTHFWIADAHFRRLDYEAAELEIVAYRDVSQQLVDNNPQNNEYLHELASAESNLGTLAYRRGHFDAARDRFVAAETAARLIVDREPDNEIYASTMATTLSWLGSTEISLGNLDTGTDLHREVVAINRANVESSDDMREREHLARALQVLSADLARLDLIDQAVVADDEAVEIFESLVHFDPENSRWIYRLARGKSIAARHRLHACMKPGVDALLSESRALLDDLIAADPADANPKIDLANVGVETARYAAMTGDMDAARSNAAQSLSAFQQLMIERADDIVTQRAYARATALLVELLLIQGDKQTSVDYADLILNDSELGVARETDVLGWVSVIKGLIHTTAGGDGSEPTGYRPLPLLPDCKWETSDALP